MGILASGIPAVLSAVGQGVETVNDLLARIKSKDDSIRGPAWQTAESAGAPAVRPLAEVMMDPDFETARAAKRALYRIVRHAGRPGAKHEAEAGNWLTFSEALPRASAAKQCGCYRKSLKTRLLR